MERPIEELQHRLGYQFSNIAYLRQALTHSSYSNELGVSKHHLLCNERLEFLGDSVLSIITSDYLYRTFPEYPEGILTRIRSELVCEKALAGYSETIGLGDFLLLGKGESQTGGARKPAVIADAFEAVLAAIYLDAGGLDALRTVEKVLLPFLTEAIQNQVAPRGYRADSKSRLQEFIQQDKEQKGQLEYRHVGESGPDHDKTFVVELYLDSNRIGKGVGHSKKDAEQAAATEALELFGIE